MEDAIDEGEVGPVRDNSDNGRRALAALRRARRAHRAAEFDVFDAFYQAYLTAVGCGVVVLFASDAVGDHRLGRVALARVAAHGPEVVGLAVAIAFGVGLRSGARGGPLVLSAADVRHVLLAPIPRERALRPLAVRQIRFAAFVGAVGGAIAGVLASHRLSGGLAPWVASGAAAGASTAVSSVGLALIASGRRWRPWVGSALGLIILGWSIFDVVAGARTSPASFVGVVALWPLRSSFAGIGAVPLPVLAAVLGTLVIGASSLEAAERRASLASQIRFAVTLQDLRTVVLLRRQLTQEHPRSRPWVPVPGLAAGGVVWRRDLRGLARWPAARLARILVLGAVAGLSLVGVWAGTTPLVLIAALALYVVGLDVLEPLAQEIDHPDIPGSMPMDLGRIRILHIPVSLAVLGAVALVGWGVSLLVAPAAIAGPVGAALLLPAVLLALSGAAASIIMGPPAVPTLALPAEVAGMRMMARVMWPPALVLVGLIPLLTAHSDVGKGKAAGPAVFSASVSPVMVGLLALAWVRYREEIHAWLKAGANASKPVAVPE